MAAQAEQAFAQTFLNTISTQPITYADDYQQPPENSLKKVPVLPVDLPEPPKRIQEADLVSSTAPISLVFKSSKPPASFTVSVQATDTISSIKAQLAALPSAPPADAQRLLLKGKALTDTKLLKEYSIKDGDTVNLMIKPGFTWDPTATTASSSSAPMDPTALSPSRTISSSSKKHARIPSVTLTEVLSPSPTGSPGLEESKTRELSLDDATNSGLPSRDLESSYSKTIAEPQFWVDVYALLRSKFEDSSDAIEAFESFLNASKAHLTPHQAAKIRDVVGVMGMAGT